MGSQTKGSPKDGPFCYADAPLLVRVLVAILGKSLWSLVILTFSAFKRVLLRVFSGQQDVQGLAIVGSHARGRARPDSDIDAVVFCLDPKRYVDHRSWLERFGRATDVRIERWADLRTVRAFYRNCLEIEFNFSTLEWARTPVDPGTRAAVSNGFEILFDPTGALARLKDAVRDSRGA